MYIVTAEEMYEIDRYAIEKGEIEGKILMENAGAQVAQAILRDYSDRTTFAVAVGSGNNGGDGFVVARYLQEADKKVEVLQLVPNQKITGDAAYHKKLWLQVNGTVSQIGDTATFTEKLATFEVMVLLLPVIYKKQTKR